MIPNDKRKSSPEKQARPKTAKKSLKVTQARNQGSALYYNKSYHTANPKEQKQEIPD